MCKENPKRKCFYENLVHNGSWVSYELGMLSGNSVKCLSVVKSIERT